MKQNEIRLTKSTGCSESATAMAVIACMTPTPLKYDFIKVTKQEAAYVMNGTPPTVFVLKYQGLSLVSLSTSDYMHLHVTESDCQKTFS